MATIEQAIEALAEVERRLRDLVGQAAANGEYDLVERITDGARVMAALAQSLRDGTPPGYRIALEPTPLTARDDVHRMEAPNRALLAKDSRSRAKPRRSKRAPTKGEYPKFFRRDDELVKIGWSKKEREEYEHKAPRRVVDALAAAITPRVANRRLFTSDDVMPLKDRDTGEELPGYQAYVVLAWFKKAGLVQQHGRSGYSVRNGSHLADVVATAWGRLPERVAQ